MPPEALPNPPKSGLQRGGAMLEELLRYAEAASAGDLAAVQRVLWEMTFLEDATRLAGGRQAEQSIHTDASAITWYPCGPAVPPPAEVQARVAAVKVVRFGRMSLLRRDNRSYDHTRTRSHSAGLFCRPGRDSRPSGISTVPRTISSHSRRSGASWFRSAQQSSPWRGWTARQRELLSWFFPSLQAGRDWFGSPAYQQIAPLRQRSSRPRGFFVEGLPVPKQ